MKRDRLLVRRGPVEFPSVQTCLVLEPGFAQIEILHRPWHVMHRDRVGGYLSFAEKHAGSFRLDVRDRVKVGEITARRIFGAPRRRFRVSDVRQHACLDDLRCFALALLRALYRTGSELPLLRAVRRVGRG